jgi:TfoX/Sxy family transcriptional regulator of competence genes
MASDLEFVEFVVDQARDAGAITFRKMFGEFALYCEGKVVALICDNKLFIKPTEAGKSFIGNVEMAPPYPGAKASYLIRDQIEDKDWLSDLIKITERELPEPKPKKRKRRKNE